MLRTLIYKVDSMQEQMGNESRQIEILRTKKNSRDKKKPLRLNNVFDGLISRLDTAQEKNI